jgi:beta-phosphoglucomutase-like phosphatase (HAD superfamily)
MTEPRALDASTVSTLLCDADGTLFGSEEPAYDASADVTNRFLAHLGAEREYSPRELQGLTNGKNFRAAAADLAELYEQTLRDTELEDWVTEEKHVVTRHLEQVLRPDPTVSGPVERLNEHFVLAVVTSSARSRMDACLEVTGLSGFFSAQRRFSAEDSLTPPTSKPDPAVYIHAGEVLGLSPHQAVAVEDSVNGTLSAVAAGFPTIGIVQFVPVEDRATRRQALLDAGAATVVESWSEVLPTLGVAAG